MRSRFKPRMARRSATLGLLTVALPLGVANGQDSRLSLDAGFAHAQPPAGVDADAATYVLAGGRVTLGPLFGSAYGGLSANTNSADWLGGSVGVYLHSDPIGPLTVGVTGLATAFTLGEPTPYDALTWRMIPELRLGAERTALVIRGQAGLGCSDVGDPRQGAPAVVTDLSSLGGSARLTRGFGALRGFAGVQAHDTQSGAFYAASLGGSGRLQGLDWELVFRIWDTPSDTELEFSIGLVLPVRRSVSLQVSGGRSGPEPLLGSPAGVGGSVVISWDAMPTLAAPEPVYVVEGGAESVVVFRLTQVDAAEVAVLGDFSDWQPISLERSGPDWLARVPIDPGLYHFGFLVDGEWHVPEDAPGLVTDEFGRQNATLVVTER